MPPRKTKRQDGRFASTLRYLDPIAGHKKRAYFYGKTQCEARVKAERARHLTISQQWASVQPVRPLAGSPGRAC
jgi:hypothetical protein